MCQSCLFDVPIWRCSIFEAKCSCIFFHILGSILSPVSANMPSVLMVCTSSDVMPKKDGSTNPSGCWYEEVAAPYLVFSEKGYDITITSVKGGKIPIDAGSLSEGFFTDECKKFKENHESLLDNTKALSEFDVTTFDAIYFPGGHATYADLQDDVVTDAINKAVAANKVLAFDCHGPSAICTSKVVDTTGKPLVEGKEVCCFTDAEEAAVGATDTIPYSMEQKLKELGAIFKGGADWGSNVCVAGNLITGQNPQSSTACANAVVAALA